MESITALTADLDELYRFALLMTGSSGAARQVLHDALADLNGELAQFRNDRHRTARFVARVRAHALERAASAPAADGGGFAAAFARLPEPERSVLALFYLDFLPVRDIAHVLKLKLDVVAGHLATGREHLGRLTEDVSRS